MQSALSDFYAEVPETSIIREVSSSELGRIVDDWIHRRRIVKGLFLAKEGSRYVACDNRYPTFDDGCYVEEFDDRRTAVKWLKDELEVWDLCRWSSPASAG